MGLLRLVGLLCASFYTIFPVRLQRSHSNIQQLTGLFFSVDFRYVLCAGVVVGKGFFISEQQMRCPQTCSTLLYLGKFTLGGEVWVCRALRARAFVPDYLWCA